MKRYLFPYAALALLNTIDAVVTFWGVTTERIDEMNPFMDWMLTINPIFFLLFKLVAVNAVVYFTWKKQVYEQTWLLFDLVVIVYTMIATLHVRTICYAMLGF